MSRIYDDPHQPARLPPPPNVPPPEPWPSPPTTAPLAPRRELCRCGCVRGVHALLHPDSGRTGACADCDCGRYHAAIETVLDPPPAAPPMIPCLSRLDQRHRLIELGHELLLALGEDPTREGLADTPRRWADTWLAFLAYDAGPTATAFDAVETDQMVLLRDVRIWSLCEHHLLPFSASLDIAYLTETRVLGISKLARLAEKHAHRLQLQERLCQQIADDLAAHAHTESVAVLARGQHLCMQMRGVRAREATMITSVVRGAFRVSGPTREEFLRLIGG